MQLPLSIGETLSHPIYPEKIPALAQSCSQRAPVSPATGQRLQSWGSMEEGSGACVYISIRGDTKEAWGPTHSLGFSGQNQERREDEFLSAISFLLRELHPSTLCIHPPSAQRSGSKITFSSLSSEEMGHKERSNAPAVQTTSPARLRLSLRQRRREMLPRDGTSPGHLAPPAAGEGVWWRAMTGPTSANATGESTVPPPAHPKREGAFGKHARP